MQEGGLRGPLSPTGLCAPGDLWPAQPVCVTGGFGCALESGGPAVLPPPAPVPSRYVLPRPGDQRVGQGAGPHGWGPVCGAGSRSSRQPGCALESGGLCCPCLPPCPAGTCSCPGRRWPETGVQGWELVLTAAQPWLPPQPLAGVLPSAFQSLQRWREAWKEESNPASDHIRTFLFKWKR